MGVRCFNLIRNEKMIENNSKSNHNDYCKNCGSEISPELSKKIKANQEDVVCELCGYHLLLITHISKEENRKTEVIKEINKEHQEEIKDELKEIYSLNIYSADRKKFGYYLTVFASRSIYNIIKQSNLNLNITDTHIEMISNSILTEIINNRVNNEWLVVFKLIKKNFKKLYRELQSELSLNQALQEVFLEFFQLLTKIIIKLIKKKDYSELQGIEYDIAEYLIKRDLFVFNIRFTVPFRYNLKICLSRLIYLRIKNFVHNSNLKLCQLKLSNIDKREIADDFVKKITNHNDIINEFLGVLYRIKHREFNSFYEQLCLELKSDNLFRESFNYYLRWLIGHVHDMICGKYKWKELSHFDRIIITKLEQLLNVELEFNSLSQDENLSPCKENKQENKLLENIQNEIKGLISKLITEDEKELFEKRAKDILKNFINGESVQIRKNIKPVTIAATIFYTIIVSTENYPAISLKKISRICDATKSAISNYYNKYFKHNYPRLKFYFNSRFICIRNVISLYFFKLMKDVKIETSELVLSLNECILENKGIPEKLTSEDFNILQEMINQYRETFVKYFSDLAEIVKHLIIASEVHKKIGAILIIRYLAEFLEEKNINLLQTSETFYRSLIEIFDFLKESLPNFFPERELRDSQYNYNKIVASKIKIYVIKNIYGGKYFKDGAGKCPECVKEHFVVNTDISRPHALEFHHPKNKKYEFSAKKLFEIFLKDRGNPDFLDDLIRLMEAEEVELICRNHHFLLQDKYFRYFEYFINWEDIFSLPPEIIHILITTAVNYHPKTKYKTTKEKESIRTKLVRYLKKRYIIESFYGEKCHTCGELNLKKHLPAFVCHHFDEEIKKSNPSDLLDNKFLCSEIVRILEKEKAGYICANCHKVIHYDKHIHLVDKIFDNKSLIQKIIEDYANTRNKFRYYNSSFFNTIGNPLKKSIRISKNHEKYLTAIYELSKSFNTVPSTALSYHLGVTHSAVSDFFKKKSVINKYVDFTVGKGRTPTKYLLTEEGKNIVSLIFHFRDYYKSLGLSNSNRRSGK